MASSEDIIVGYLLFAEYNGYCRTDTEITLNRKLSIAYGADVLDDSKTKSGAADALGMGFVHSVEALAKARKVFLLNTNARVLNLKDYSVFGFFNRNGDRAAVLIILNGVRNEIFNQLEYHRLVSSKGCRTFNGCRNVSALCLFRKSVQYLLGKIVEFDFGERSLGCVTAFDLGEHQHIGNQRAKAKAFFVDASKLLL